jgi:catechol 2,3-dioxygenase-like lactoylglutathione lyase family enzyme
MTYQLEMVQFPVTDIDRAKAFYLDRMGCSLVVDRDVPEGKRVVQVLPPGSACAIGLGDSLTEAPSGSAQALLVVRDIQAARDELTSRGVEVRNMRFRDADHRWVEGIHPKHADYMSFAEFNDPDGNLWFLQERGFAAPRGAAPKLDVDVHDETLGDWP